MRARKVSVSLDPELVRELERGDEGLSKQVNDAVRDSLERRRRLRLLRSLLSELEQKRGRASEKAIAKYAALLG